jgi:hypothetical protein
MTEVRLSDDVVFRSFGSEMVLLNLKTGQYHGLKGSGGRMLEVIAEVGDLDQAALQIADEYGAAPEVVTNDMRRLCQELAERSLVVLGPEPDG